MACNRCEQLGEENKCDPKEFCQCKPVEHIDWDERETEMMIKTLSRKPSPKVQAFYDEIKAKLEKKEDE